MQLHRASGPRMGRAWDGHARKGRSRPPTHPSGTHRLQRETAGVDVSGAQDSCWRSSAIRGTYGSSAPYMVRMFRKVALFEPLSPLTGEAKEWRRCGNDTLQNKRCSHVFQGVDGQAYNIRAVVFREPDGGC